MKKGMFVIACLFLVILFDISAEQIIERSVISGVPAYVWHHGCMPTSFGMVLGYWDARFPDLIEGNAAKQTPFVNAMIANREHFDDYALPIDYGDAILLDKSSLGSPVHVDNSLADFLLTSRSKHRYAYGISTSSDLLESVIGKYLNYLDLDYVVESEFYHWGFYNEDELWTVYKREIKSYHPVIIGISRHAVVGVGYIETDTRKSYLSYTTYDKEPEWHPFTHAYELRPWSVCYLLTAKLTKVFYFPSIFVQNKRFYDHNSNRFYREEINNG